jgi:CheY-like chemotaxis protein
VAETLAPQAAAKGLKLAAYVAAGVPERVTGDPLRLQQILFNLLGNAIKFTETGSVRLSLETAGGQALCIKVADTGIGLSREQQSRLFQPFVQADSSTTRRFGGTGLGLSIVRRLAQAMQGGIDVESEPGKGATFMVTLRLGEAAAAAPRAEPVLEGLRLGLDLPDVDEAQAIARYFEDAGARVMLADAGAGFTGIRIDGIDGEVLLSDGPATPEAAAPGLPRPWRRDALIRAVARAAGRTPVVAAVPVARAAAPLNGRVLVVDDNSVNRKILARQLELAGASTDSAAGGEEALELWRKGGYDLVLADLQMPTMDGFELARRIRQSEAAERRPRTPILAVTASALEEQEQKSRAAGMDGFITKPIGIEQLKATLDVWLKDTAE